MFCQFYYEVQILKTPAIIIPKEVFLKIETVLNFIYVLLYDASMTNSVNFEVGHHIGKWDVLIHIFKPNGY